MVFVQQGAGEGGIEGRMEGGRGRQEGEDGGWERKAQTLQLSFVFERQLAKKKKIKQNIQLIQTNKTMLSTAMWSDASKFPPLGKVEKPDEA